MSQHEVRPNHEDGVLLVANRRRVAGAPEAGR